MLRLICSVSVWSTEIQSVIRIESLFKYFLGRKVSYKCYFIVCCTQLVNRIGWRSISSLVAILLVNVKRMFPWIHQIDTDSNVLCTHYLNVSLAKGSWSESYFQYCVNFQLRMYTETSSTNCFSTVTEGCVCSHNYVCQNGHLLVTLWYNLLYIKWKSLHSTTQTKYTTHIYAQS